MYEKGRVVGNHDTMTYAEAAEALGVKESTLEVYVGQGKLERGVPPKPGTRCVTRRSVEGYREARGKRTGGRGGGARPRRERSEEAKAQRLERDTAGVPGLSSVEKVEVAAAEEAQPEPEPSGFEPVALWRPVELSEVAIGSGEFPILATALLDDAVQTHAETVQWAVDFGDEERILESFVQPFVTTAETVDDAIAQLFEALELSLQHGEPARVEGWASMGGFGHYFGRVFDPRVDRVQLAVFSPLMVRDDDGAAWASLKVSARFFPGEQDLIDALDAVAEQLEPCVDGRHEWRRSSSNDWNEWRCIHDGCSAIVCRMPAVMAEDLESMLEQLQEQPRAGSFEEPAPVLRELVESLEKREVPEKLAAQFDEFERTLQQAEDSRQLVVENQGDAVSVIAPGGRLRVVVPGGVDMVVLADGVLIERA